VFGSPKEERLWEYLVTQEQPVRVLTHAYARSLSQLPIFPSLPPTAKRKPRIYHINEETFAAPSLEDIMLESLRSIDTPWEEILKDPPSKGNPWPDLENPNEEHSGETFNQDLHIHSMANVPPPGGNPPLPPPPGGNQPPPPLGALPPWLAQDATVASGKQHALPKNAERVLPKFDPKWGDTADNHIHSFFLVVRMLGVVDEDVVCCLFPFTLIGMASTWYFSLRIGSITSWGAFQQAFLNKFGDDKTTVALVLELSHLKNGSQRKGQGF